MSTRATLRLVAALTALLVAFGVAPAAYAASNTECTSAHDGDMVAGKAWTDKSTHRVGGETAGIDSWATCDVDVPWDADEMVDTYMGATVYRFNASNGTWEVCIGPVNRWRGYWDQSNITWYADLDNQDTKCGWATKPIKARHIAKGQWKDGTIKSVTVIITDTEL